MVVTGSSISYLYFFIFECLAKTKVHLWMIADCALSLPAIKQCDSVRNAEANITEIKIQTLVKLFTLSLQNVS